MKQFRKTFRSDVEWHEQAQTIVFLVLGVAVSCLPLSIAWPLLTVPRSRLMAHAAVTIVYLLSVTIFGFINWDREDFIEKRWQQVLKNNDQQQEKSASTEHSLVLSGN